MQSLRPGTPGHFFAFDILLCLDSSDPYRVYGIVSTPKENALKRIFALWRVVAGQDLRLLWFALRHEARPVWLLPGLAVLGLFAVEPLNFAVPVLGAVDELVLLPFVLHGMTKMLPAHVLEGYAYVRSGRRRRPA